MYRDEMTLRQLNHGKPLLDYDPGYHMTKAMNTCIQLYDKKALEDYSLEDLTIMLSQQIMPDFLVEMALNHLKAQQGCGQDHMAFALLQAVSQQKEAYWMGHEDQRQVLKYLLKQYDLWLGRAKYQMGLMTLEAYRQVEKLANEA